MYDTIVEPRAFTVFRPVLWMHWIVFVVIVLALILFEQFCSNTRCLTGVCSALGYLDRLFKVGQTPISLL